ncbi:MarR family winged helix-turn-helix transcriptional regulator [Cellulomonas sp. PhB143]|uniref:MarR family winged helix-turn-helix transcriptional regulator n=1 Tax=Cellulomonas sp. PhB143 TaxID=2485186 RepID=UPI000F47E84D|nr:MarR family transcriptional regulator [Cellulomonas sp. PhB143]ROS76590.1 MarR family transcriptional regulator [Cellulomonas sp. PhB143]
MTTEPAPAEGLPDDHAVASDLRVVLGLLTRRLRAQSTVPDLTRSQASVLRRIEREGSLTTSELARAEGIRPQSMGAVVAVLEQAGLVQGERDPRDGRKTLLSLTAEAREMYASGRIAREDWLLRTMRAELDPAERAELARAVALLRRIAAAR